MARKRITAEAGATGVAVVPAQVNVMDRSNPKWWVQEVLHDAWQQFDNAQERAVDAAIHLGRELLDAKEHLGHGNFLRLFRDHANPIENALPFNARWARNLMTLASAKTIANRQYTTDLPASVQTLATLARLDDEVIEQAIESGEITPKLTQQQAKELVREKRQRSEPQAAPQELPTVPSPAPRVEETEDERLFRIFGKFKSGFLELWTECIGNDPKLQRFAKSYIREMFYTLTGDEK